MKHTKRTLAVLFTLAALIIPQAALAQTATAAWTSGTAVDTVLQITVGAGDVTVSFNLTGGTMTAGALNFEIGEGSVNEGAVTWYPATCTRYSALVVEASYTLTGANQVWSCPIGGPMLFRVRLNPVIAGTGTANVRANVSGFAGRLAPLGSSVGKTNQLKTGSLVTTAVTADQVVLTYTVTVGKTLYVQYLELEGRLTVVAATATILGDISLETPSGTKVITTTAVNPTTSEPGKLVIQFPEPIAVSSGAVIRAVVTPAAATSMTWKANFGGYEK